MKLKALSRQSFISRRLIKTHLKSLTLDFSTQFIPQNLHNSKPTWPTDQLRNRASQYMRCLIVSKFPVTPSLSHAGCNFINFCFDFHQFLFFFIDIFKTLESVTTFIELFLSKHRFVISGSRNTWHGHKSAQKRRRRLMCSMLTWRVLCILTSLLLDWIIKWKLQGTRLVD